MNKVSKFAFLGLAASVMGGCATHKIDESAEIVDAGLDNASLLKDQGDTLSRKATTSVIKDQFFLATTPYKMSNRDTLPSFFEEKILFSQPEPVSVHEILNKVTAETGIHINITQDAYQWINGDEIEKDDKKDAGGAEQPDKPQGGFSAPVPGSSTPWPQGESKDGTEKSIKKAHDRANYAGVNLRLLEEKFSFKFRGTIEEVLDRVTQKLDVNWKWENGKVEIYKLEVKHYIFDGANASVEFQSSITTKSSNEDSSSGHNTTYTTNYKPMYDEISTTLSKMMTTNGKFHINTNTGMITVTDVPSVHREVEKYIEQINVMASKRILIKTQVIDIVSDDNGDYGMDLNAIYSGSSRFNFNFNPLDPSAIGGNFEIGLIDGTSSWNGSKALVSALNTMTKNIYENSSTVTTQNGQPVPVQIIDRKNFVEKVSSETDDKGNKSYEITTNKVMPGFSMTALPKLTSKGTVAMQLAIDLKKLNAMNDFVAGDISATLPDETQKSFMQNVNIKNGQTLMLSGFETTINDSEVKSVGGKESWLFGGKKVGGKKKVMTLILVTPYIMAN
ncbi:hypothetical protein [Vibrio metschnikovii]|uniref:Type II/III secretion system secretin-like domain-containing protein n=1 Tax=Vibrio metschnikovii TaxID=28172 RepID=A0A9X0R9E6_VIBME|nr:hypothetical protein [Vibrio metschnikovii]MBC5852084.1 hypothetical protein [Vibrio metschnikovii]